MKKYFIYVLAGAAVIFIHESFNKAGVDKVELGRLLFFDPILSRDNSISCASCHKPEFAFADNTSVSFGVRNIKGTRNTPSAMNARRQTLLFWDGRAPGLEAQALMPIENPNEMNLPLDEALKRLSNSDTYRVYFKTVFDSQPTKENLAAAIGAFERTLETSDSPFDEWKFSDDSNAVSDAVKRGFDLFNNKGKCIRCHFGPDFTTNEFRNIGLFNGRELNDSGRIKISRKAEDIGRFKTPGLRNVAVTAPYMHNGMFRTLREVIDFYNDPSKVVDDAINRDTLLNGNLGLTEQDKTDLEAFLISLTDKRFENRPRDFYWEYIAGW
jgi:cytochrome c peroxidase